MKVDIKDYFYSVIKLGYKIDYLIYFQEDKTLNSFLYIRGMYKEKSLRNQIDFWGPYQIILTRMRYELEKKDALAYDY